MNWSIDFAPVLPAPFFWAAGALAVCSSAICCSAARAERCCARPPLRRCIAALANPTLREEQRESLANVAIVIVDESASQTLGDRKAQTAAVKADLEAKLKKIPNLTVKWVPASRPGDMTAPGTHLFADLNKALADTPPDRLAGVILLTDGEVHDVPKSAALARLRCPRARAAHRRARRVRPPHRDPEGAALRHRRPIARHRGRRARSRKER